MNKQYLLASFIISGLIIPVFANADIIDNLRAQIQALQHQIAVLQAQMYGFPSDTSTTATPSSCPNLYRTLWRGTSGDDVALLQRFLINEELLSESSATGYYGPATEEAVQQWQAKNSIVSYGDAGSTGYGVVGSRTRSAISSRCAANSSAVSPWTNSPSTISSQPTNSQPTNPQSCTFSGQTVPSGASIIAYQSPVASTGTACRPETRTCTNGTLSGSFTSPSCYVQQAVIGCPQYMLAACTGTLVPQGTDQNGCSLPPRCVESTATTVPQSCSFNGQTIASGSSVTAYQSSFAPTGAACQSETRTCTSGVLSGSFTAPSCFVQQVICPIPVQVACNGTLVPQGTDQNGCSLPPICINSTASASLSATPTSGTAPLLVHFVTPGPTLASISSYQLDFGDGQSSPMQSTPCQLNSLSGASCYDGSADHTYTAAGTYTAKLRNTVMACAPVDCNVVGTVTITVTPPSTASGGTQIVRGVGEQEGTFLIQRINPGSVDGLWANAYPVASYPGSPRTLYIGEDIGYACEGVSDKLTGIDYNGQKVTFTQIISDPPIGGCPRCLLGSAKIQTPNGTIEVKNISPGISVWTQGSDGNRHQATVLQAGRTAVPPGHMMVDLRLSDGRELIVSPGHPLSDGRLVGNIQVGDIVQGAVVISANRVPNIDGYTYDILPSGDTGDYWAGGILMRSTLSK